MTIGEVLRTPDGRFDNLPDFDYAPNYVDDLPGYEGLRLHYLDEGPIDAEETFLCLHGEPTWCYLYRRMLPVFLATGSRVIAPDFFGFGRSDKPVDDAIYTWDFHRNALSAFIERMNVSNITLVCQDWGGLLGLTLPMDMPERFSRLLVMNTTLATGEVPLTEGFHAWRNYCASTDDLAVGRLLKRSTPHLSDAEVAAYDAPFPDARYKAGVRRFPQLVAEHSTDPGAAQARQACDWWSKAWSGQSFMAVGLKDPVLGADSMQWLRQQIRACPEPYEIADGGHFVQEWGEEIAHAALRTFNAAYIGVGGRA